MRPHLRRLVGTAATLALGAIAAPPAGAQAPAPPCTLLTPAQVAAEVGAPMRAGEATGTTGCQWVATTEVASAIPRVTLVFYGADAWSGMTANFARVTRTTVSGLGDAAVYSTVGNLTTLSVKRGRTVFALRLYGIDGAEKQMAVERALALAVLGKI